ncbi:unnamed protein product [Clavelina lepadiformis]|uniref:acid phosphatase n=1 Tax=Clavelina lepadiformis TaxID=159417 RepID=A0ABP0GRC8_CLALP
MAVQRTSMQRKNKYLSCLGEEMGILWLLVIFAVIASYEAAENDLELVFANVVWRHGARSSLHSYPSDPYNDKSIWPQGPGQLTQVGMSQEFELGQFFRLRYNNLLSKQYNRSEIYIRSTDIDRTLMSAECNMAGLYPPSGQQEWNGTDTTWQPIPVHTVPVELDQLLVYPIKNCPKYSKLLSQIYKSSQFKAMEDRYLKFLKELEVFTAWGSTPNFTDAKHIYDTLICEKFHNLTLPAWVTPERFSVLTDIAGIDMAFMFGAIVSEFQNKMAKSGGGGSLLKVIVDNIQGHINGTSTYKLVAYSAHDTTVNALLSAIGQFNMLPPPFASSVLLEVYKTKSRKQYIVKAYYRNSTVEAPMPLRVLGCDFSCPLDEFKKLCDRVIPHDIDSDCDRNNEPAFHTTLLLFIVSGLLLLTWAIIIIVLCCRRNSRNEFQKPTHYQSLPLDDAASTQETNLVP